MLNRLALLMVFLSCPLHAMYRLATLNNIFSPRQLTTTQLCFYSKKKFDHDNLQTLYTELNARITSLEEQTKALEEKLEVANMLIDGQIISLNKEIECFREKTLGEFARTGIIFVNIGENLIEHANKLEDLNGKLEATKQINIATQNFAHRVNERLNELHKNKSDVVTIKEIPADIAGNLELDYQTFKKQILNRKGD